MSFMIEARNIEKKNARHAGFTKFKVKPDYIAERLKKLAAWAYHWKWHKHILVERGTGYVVRDAKLKQIFNTGLRPPFPWKDIEKEYFDQLERSEGRVQYMYLDSEGNVTVGLGHLIESAQAAQQLRFYWARPGIDYEEPATAEAIRQAYEAVKKRQDLKDRIFTVFEPLTEIRMSKNDVGDLAVLDIWQTIGALKQKTEFSGFDTFPPTAKLGLLDIAYNAGVEKIFMSAEEYGFPEFRKAVAMRDWKRAAKESGRRQAPEERNTQVRQWFEEAAKKEPYFVHPTGKRDALKQWYV